MAGRWRRQRLTTGILLALACAVSASGCTPAPAPSPTPPQTGFASDAEAFAAAEATYRAYVDALNQVSFADPATFEPVFAWSGGSLEQADRRSFESAHESGFTIQGDFRVVSMTGIDWHRGSGTVHLQACLDVSNTRITDATGAPQQAEERAPRLSLLLTLEPADTATHLRLLDTQPRDDGTSC